MYFAYLVLRIIWIRIIRTIRRYAYAILFSLRSTKKQNQCWQSWNLTIFIANMFRNKTYWQNLQIFFEFLSFCVWVLLDGKMPGWFFCLPDWFACNCFYGPEMGRQLPSMNIFCHKESNCRVRILFEIWKNNHQ